MPINVLILDDSLVMRKIIKRALTMSQLKISQYHDASTYREGLTILRDEQIDVVFLDLNLPDIQSTQTILEIKKQPKAEKIVVVALASHCSQSKCDELKSMDVVMVPKPFTPELLKSKIEHIT